MKPLIYEPKCIIYEYKSSLFTFYALSLLFFSTAKVIRISQPHNKKDTFSCIFIVQAFAQTTSIGASSSLIPYYISQRGTKMITLCLGFINIRKQNESKATHKTTQRHKTQNIEYHFITSEDTLLTIYKQMRL